jgi:hypothetical protein
MSVRRLTTIGLLALLPAAAAGVLVRRRAQLRRPRAIGELTAPAVASRRPVGPRAAA